MNFAEFWRLLQEELRPGTPIRNWTQSNGYLGDSFEIASVRPSYVEVSAPNAQNIQHVPQTDFQRVFEMWAAYRAGATRRAEIRDTTRFSKYIISIIHHLGIEDEREE